MRRHQVGFGWALAALAIGVLVAARADSRGAGVPVQGTARLSLSIAGSEARAELVAPAMTLLGFARTPGTEGERETLRLARDNLNAGEAMIRFNTHAACRLQSAKVDARLPSEAVPATPGGQDAVPIQVAYRFHCEQPKALDSAALGLFTGFPALRRVLVRYVTPDGQGGAELTADNPLVNFVPF